MQSFERRLERTVEGVFARAFRGSLRPIELGRRLLREMDDNRSVDVKGRTIVPNAFTFRVSPHDHQHFAEIEDALVAELAEAAREHARDEDYFFVGPVSVQLSTDPKLKAGRFELSSRLREAARPVPRPPAPPPSEPLAISHHGLHPELEPHDGSGLPAGSLLLPNGDRYRLGAHTVAIGRNPVCDLVLADANVSRRHAEVRPVGMGYVVADLGSTNGTRVNGKVVEGEHPLHDGDVITVGATRLHFEAS